MTDTGNFDAAPIDPTHGSSGPGGPLPGPEIRPEPAGFEQPESNDSGSVHPAEERHVGSRRDTEPESFDSPSDLEHPPWCSPAHCTVTADRDRWHASRPITVRGTGDTSDLTITVQLFAWPDGRNAYANIAPTLVDMEGQRHTEEWPVPGELALELGHVLVSLARQATP